jgi:hypothetical protein
MPSSRARAAACSGPRAAERKQHEIARVVPARERNHADRAGHAIVGDAQDRRGHLDAVQPERPAELLGKDRLDPAHIGGPGNSEQAPGVEPAEHEVRIGDRRLGAAASVADRSGMRAGAARADLQHAVLAQVGDRAPAGTDRVHVDHRHVHRHRVLELELRGHLRHAVEDQADVGRRASHVVGDRVRKAGGGGAARGGDHARGRAGHHGVHGGVGGDRCGNGAAVSLHHEQVAREAAPLQFVGELRQVAVEDRLDRRVHRSGDAALVFAIFGEDRVPGGHVARRPQLLRDGKRALLVRGIDVAVQEMDHQRFASGIGEPAHRVAHGGLVERRYLLALGIHALRHLVAQLAGNQRLEPSAQPVRGRACAPAQFQHVAEPLRRDEAGPRKPALEQGVGRGGGAVNEHRHVGEREVRFRERRKHPERLVLDRRRHLRQAHRAGRGLQRDQVGERAADVDSGDPAHASG